MSKEEEVVNNTVVFTIQIRFLKEVKSLLSFFASANVELVEFEQWIGRAITSS